MQKKILVVFTAVVLLVVGGKVSALGNDNFKYYTNSNGVTLTQKEFDFVNQFYGKDYFETMTEEDYEWIADMKIDTSDVDIETTYDFSNNGIMLIPTFGTPYKQVSIAKSCNSICTIIISADWFVKPSSTGFDLIGARFYNTSLYSQTITTKVVSSKGTQYFSNNRVLYNGVGTSVQLPEDATNISIQQKLYLNKSGRVYASYQHAMSNVSLQTSLQYVFENGGLGNVFDVYGDAEGKYDQMNGVQIDL